MPLNTQVQANLRQAPAHIRQPRTVQLTNAKDYENFLTTSYNQFQENLTSLTANWLPGTWVLVDKETIVNGRLPLGKEQLLKLAVQAYDHHMTWWGTSAYIPPILGSNEIQALSIRQNFGDTNYRSHPEWFRPQLQKFNGLMNLELCSPVVASPANLKLIARQKSLMRLDLNSLVNLTDDGLAEISTLANLNYLNLSNLSRNPDGYDQLTARGYQHLQKLEQLTHLTLANRRLDTKAIKQIGMLGGLKYLKLGGTVDEADLKHLASLPSLKRLDIDTVRLGSTGLKCLSQLESLAVLTIDDPRTVSATGIKQLAGLKTLRILSIRNCQPKFDLLALMELRCLDALEEFHADSARTSFDWS